MDFAHPFGARYRTRVALIALALAVLAGCGEYRAERTFKRIVAGEKTRPPSAVRADLQELVSRWPKTRAAARARQEIEWLDDFERSSTRGEGLLAWDAVRRVGAAVERFRLARGAYPGSFADLVPSWLPGAVLDPWGHAIGYLRTPGGYQVICYGSDGIPGGTGDATDTMVENGREIRQGGSPPDR